MLVRGRTGNGPDEARKKMRITKLEAYQSFLTGFSVPLRPKPLVQISPT